MLLVFSVFLVHIWSSKYILYFHKIRRHYLYHVDVILIKRMQKVFKNHSLVI